MGLDGHVACDCIEKGTSEVPKALTGLVKIDEDTGTPYLDSRDRKLRETYSKWQASKPCPHEHFTLLTHRLGHAPAINRIRKIVEQEARDPKVEFPILWSRVLYSGVHSGDAIAVGDVGTLQSELRRLSLSSGHEEFVGEFFARLEELVEASLRVGKPLGF